jgi:hypothetical protein
MKMAESPMSDDKNGLIPDQSHGNHNTHNGNTTTATAIGTSTKKEKTIRYLFKKPKSFLTNEQRQKQAQEHKHENWMELFMDLFYVAFFLKLGVILHTCGTGLDIMTYVASVFIGVYMCKFDFDQYMNKFTSEDLVHKLFFAVYSLGLAVMVLDVNESSHVSDDEVVQILPSSSTIVCSTEITILNLNLTTITRGTLRHRLKGNCRCIAQKSILISLASPQDG